MILWFLFFLLLTRNITFFILWIFNHPCISGINLSLMLEAAILKSTLYLIRTKTWPHPTACRVQCWASSGPTVTLWEHSPTHEQTGCCLKTASPPLPQTLPLDMTLPTWGPLRGNQMGKKWKQYRTLFSWAPKSLQMVTAAMKLKDACSLKEKLWQTKTAYEKAETLLCQQRSV